MPGKQIDKIRKAKYKAARLNDNSIAESLRQAGYSEATARISSGNSIVKQSEKEIMEEVKASDISVDWVVNKLNQELVSIHAKSSDRVRILELLGKYLAMFNDNKPLQVNLFTGDMLKDLPPIDVSTSSTTT